MSMSKSKTNDAEKEEIINQFMPFIRYTAYRLSWKLPPHMTIDDLISVGLMGLMAAFEKFKPGRVKFKSYAEIRIKGAMLDELRTAAWIPRSTMKKINEINGVREKLEQKLGRAPNDHEVARLMKIPIYDYFKMLQSATSYHHLRLEDFKGDTNTDSNMDILECIPDPYAESSLNILEEKDKKENLIKLLDTLPEKHRLVLSLYYLEELTLKEIGRVINLTESRVCQIRDEALDNLRTRINQSCNLVA